MSMVSSGRSKSCRSSSSLHKNRVDAMERTYVDHTYHDHLHDPYDLPPTISLDSRKKGPRGGVTVAFPEKLHEMLSVVGSEGVDEVVSWLPHGRCFMVRKKRDFVEEIMPRFFHQSKLTSFQRQLNLYGFIRLTAGKDRGAYYHELFLRGRPDLCRLMVRTRVKGNGMKAASSPATEPNFYSMEPAPADDSVRVVTHNHRHEEREDDDEGGESSAGDATHNSKETDDSVPVMSFPVSGHGAASPAIVSLPPTPDQTGRPINGNRMEDTKKYPYYPFTDPLSPPSMPDCFDDLHNGDEAFFEGLKFRYLDRVEVEDDIDAFPFPPFTSV